MALVVYSTSSAFRSHLDQVLTESATFNTALGKPALEDRQICLLHISSFHQQCFEWLRQYSRDSRLAVGICSDSPDIAEMLECVELGAKAYCNSFMQEALYQQLVRLLGSGQSWFPPRMLEQTFSLARTAMKGKDNELLLQELTPREKEIALLVVEGLSNRHIADRAYISEHTVKTHLTNIFVKLQIKDRVALVLYLK
ncbi:MAG: two-component system nitrate/nitrite response regulator NarL [Gammaproteobacteria bacterium]|jgi:two-component system nitrate/nitrite response regulator NarL